MTAHVTPGMLAAYAGGDLGDPASWAVEAHLETCAGCRERLGGLAPAPITDLLAGARAAIDVSVRGGPPPVRRRRGRRLLHRWATWTLLPVAVLTATAVLAAFALDGLYPGRPSLVLLLAPIAPLAGLAVSWSRHSEPGWETVAGTSRAGLELLLRRTVGVLVMILPPLAVAGSLLGKAPALWLLPCLTFTAATLLLGGLIGVSRAAVVLGGGWLLSVVLPAVVTVDPPVLIEPAALPGWAAAAALATALTVLRSHTLKHFRSWN